MFPDGTSQVVSPALDLDVVSHEFGHGFLRTNQSWLDYDTTESRDVDEMFGDLSSVAVKAQPGHSVAVITFFRRLLSL